MPKTSNQTKRHGPNNRTRSGAKKPKVPKSWYGRVALRQLAKAIDRLDETAKTFEIREAIRTAKREPRYTPRLKALRERREAEEAYTENCSRQARARKRDGCGRFAAKRAGESKPNQ